ncbi:hypothetical protein T484DRAFT_3071216 [Baffinella frigidus]|nr:hypothetical protein T484DRAFT_3071216 [Cryptophyta sp. CCMP2293]
MAEVLLERGKVLQALRYIKERPSSVKVAPRTLLDAARGTNNVQVFCAAFRYVEASIANPRVGPEATRGRSCLPRGCEEHEAYWNLLCVNDGVLPPGTPKWKPRAT